MNALTDAAAGRRDDVGTAASEIEQAIARHGGKGHYGLRVDESGGPHTALKIGDAVPKSRIWKDGDPTSKTLAGSSAIRVAGRTKERIKETLQGMALGQEARSHHYYYGDHVHLIHSPEPPHKGADMGEGVFKNATLVGRWRKHHEGMSPIKPNGAGVA